MISLYLYHRKESDISILHSTWRKCVHYVISGDVSVRVFDDSGSQALACRKS